MPPFSSFRGHVTWLSQTYRVELNLTADSQLPHSSGNYGFNLTVTTPSQETFLLGINSNVQQKNSSVQVYSRINYKSLVNMEYNLTSVVVLEYLGIPPHSCHLHSRLNFRASNAQERSLDMELKYKETPEERIVYVKVR